MNISEEQINYQLYKMIYINLMLKKEEYKDYDDFKCHLLFPNNWISSQNYSKKIEYLKKAIEANACLNELDGISEFEEGIKYK